MRVDEFYEFVEDGFLDEALFVGSRREGFEVYGGFDGFAEGRDETDGDVSFE